MADTDAIAAMKVSDVLRQKGGDEVPVNSHVVPARSDHEPDYDAMRRIASGENEDVDEGATRE